MSRHIQASATLCANYAAAIDVTAGCPIRGITYGGPDRVHPTTPGPGWTVTVVFDILAVNPGLAVLEVPDNRTQHLGQNGVPNFASTVTDAGLPANLRTLVYARRGLDENGNPL